MKKPLIFVVCAIFLILPLVSCLPSATSQQSNPVAYQSDITTLQQADRNLDDGIKAVDGRVTAWAERVTTAETKIGILQGQSPANTYTQAQVDQKIADAIAALKSNQSWITSSTHTTPAGTTEGEYGELMDTDGDLELWLEKVSGIASDVLMTTIADDQMARYDFVVVNKDTSDAHDFKINLMFYPDRVVGLRMGAGVHDTRVSVSGGATYTVGGKTTGTEDLNPLSIYQNNTSRILKSDAEDYTVWLYISQSPTTAAVEWDWTITIDDRD